MAEVIHMPLMSDTMTEGVVVAWHKKIGDTVKSGELLAEIETDKATMEFEAPENGVLLYHAETGKGIAVNAILAILGKANEDIAALLNTNGTTQKGAVAADTSTKQESQNIAPISPTTELTDNNRLKASPLAKSMAKESHVNLAQINGTGDDGRIVKRDVEAFLQQQKTPQPQTQIQNQQQIQTQTPIVPTQEQVQTLAPPPPPIEQIGESAAYQDVRVSQMRKTIARRLAESKFSAPHFYLKMEVNMDKIMQYRQSLNELSPVKISFNDLIVKAVAMSLRKHAAINASWLGDVIRYNQHINVGVAVAVEEGLLVPVLRHADQKSLSEIATQTRELAQKAKERKLQPNDMQGNTFTISNLGMFDIDEFTAIINPPDSCILAVGKINQVPAVIDGTIGIANKMKLTLSCDHRVVDGATGAQFLQTLKSLLEEPMRLLL